MDIMLIVLIIPFFVILYQIYDGEILSRRKYGSSKVHGKTQPVKFWSNIFLQIVIAGGLIALYQMGYIN